MAGINPPSQYSTGTSISKVGTGDPFGTARSAIKSGKGGSTKKRRVSKRRARGKK